MCRGAVNVPKSTHMIDDKAPYNYFGKACVEIKIYRLSSNTPEDNRRPPNRNGYGGALLKANETCTDIFDDCIAHCFSFHENLNSFV